jgi:hypothetical protein
MRTKYFFLVFKPVPVVCKHSNSSPEDIQSTPTSPSSSNFFTKPVPVVCKHPNSSPEDIQSTPTSPLSSNLFIKPAL